jgi:hypothetical protein
MSALPRCRNSARHGQTLCAGMRENFENFHEALYSALFNHDELLKDTLP